MTVVPRGVAPGFLYRGCAIALALALWALEKQAPGVVRAAVSTWHTVGASQHGRWRSLGRWVEAVSAARVLAGCEVDRSQPLRWRASRIASWLVSCAPHGLREGSVTARACAGGSAAA